MIPAHTLISVALAGLMLVSGMPARAATQRLYLDTFAGARIAGERDGGADTARFDDPYGLVAANDGSLYVADGGEGNRIRKVARNGQVSTVAGARAGFIDGQGAAAAFRTPSALAIDTAGNLYVADTGNHAIRKVTPAGQVSTVAGDSIAGDRNGVAGQARFNGPVGIAVSGRGDIYVADTYNDRLRVIDAKGAVRHLAGSGIAGFRDGPAADARFHTPCAIAFDRQGNLYIADTGNRAIRKLDRHGQVSTVARVNLTDDTTPLALPFSLLAQDDGTVIAGDLARGHLATVSATGVTRLSIETGPEGQRLYRPAGLAAIDGVLYVADAAAHAIVALHNRPGAAPRKRAAVHDELPVGSLWPLAPQDRPHHISGTMGEPRGSLRGPAPRHFHHGLDIPAPPGTPVLAMTAATVSSPLALTEEGGLEEGLQLAALSYIHLQVGRNGAGQLLDPNRFIGTYSRTGILTGVRIRRGARFATGDVLGSVNAMRHVHLEYRPAGAFVNPLLLDLKGWRDGTAPRIGQVRLVGADGLAAPRTNNVLQLRRGTSPYRIEVGAYDPGTPTRRRLGLYRLGYQVLQANRSVADNDATRTNLVFSQLPPDSDFGLVMADTCQAPYFCYTASNVLRAGRAKPGAFDISALRPGRYLLRIVAADYAGNEAHEGRDIALDID